MVQNIKKPNENQKQDSSRMSSWTEFVVQYHCQDEHEEGNCLRWSEQEGERSWHLSLWVDVEEGAGLAGLVAQEKNWTRSCPLYLEHIG